MSFLYPQFLFGLLALAIPVIIHLFNFQKPKVVYFTNVKLLRNVKEITNNKLKIKHILVLLSRLLFITFLVLAFAQPFISKRNSSRLINQNEAFIYLDNSYSMQSEVEDGKALDAAIKSVAKIKDLYPQNIMFRMLTNDFESKDQYLVNKEKLSERLSEIGYSNFSREMESVVSHISNRAVQSTSQNKPVFMFSDFQKTTAGDLSKITFDSTFQYHLIPVHTELSNNIYIDSVWLADPIVRSKEQNIVKARVINNSGEAVSDFLIKLFIDDNQAGTAAINLAAGSNEVVDFKIYLKEPGVKKCKINFEDFPVTFDNEFFFVINVSPRINILHLYEEKNSFIPTVYSKANTFNLTSQRIGDFDYSLLAVSNLIILENLRRVPEALTNPLKDFVAKGGSILIYPSSSIEQESYNNFFRRFNLPAINKAKPDSSLPQINFTLSPPDLNNPFFKDVFEKKDRNMDMPYAIPVFLWNNKGEKLLSYKNGDSFFSVFASGPGKIFLAASPLKSEFTNFQRHATFVPVMYKIAFQSLPSETSLSHTLQDPAISLTLDVRQEKSVFEIAGDNFKVIPHQRINGRSLIFSLPEQNFKPGFYDLMLGDSVITTLAFNHSKKESDLSSYSGEELKSMISEKKNVHIYEGSLEKFVSEFEENNIGISLWKYCLVICLIFLLCEILLLRFY